MKTQYRVSCANIFLRLFTSELVIRAGRADVHVLEIPITLAEKRPPSINLVKRVPNVIRGLAKRRPACRRP